MPLTLTEVITLAAQKAGSLGALAEEMERHQNRLSEWKKGTRRPDAGEIAFLAEKAGLPILTTLAEIEAQLDEKHSHVWRAALGKLTAAGVAASVLMGSALTFPDEANAAQNTAQGTGRLYIMSTIRRRIKRLLVQFSSIWNCGKFATLSA